MIQTRFKKGVFNMLTSLISVLISIALGFIVPRLVLVTYGSEINGLIGSINQFIAYLVLFETGITSAAMQVLYKPVAENNREQINPIMSALNKNYRNIGFCYLVGLFALSVVYPFIVLKSGSSLNYIQVFLCVLFSGLGNALLFFIQGKYRVLLQVEGKSYILNNLQSIIQILISISKIILINLGINIVSVIVATFILNLIQVIYILIYINKKYKWLNLKCGPSKVALSKRKYVFIHEITWIVFQNIDIVLLTIFCDLKLVSVYTIYKLVVSSLQSFLAIPFDSCNFALGQFYNEDIEKYKKTIDFVEIYFIMLCFIFFTVALILYTPFIVLYTKTVTDIQYVDKYLPVLFVLMEMLVFMRKPMSLTINYAGHFKETIKYAVIEMILNLVLSIVGCIFIGIYGLLIATIIALFYRFIAINFYTVKNIINRSFVKIFSYYIINFCTMFGLYFIISLFISINSFLDFIVWGIVCVIISSITYLTINLIIFKSERRLFLSFLKNKKKRYG